MPKVIKKPVKKTVKKKTKMNYYRVDVTWEDGEDFYVKASSKKEAEKKAEKECMGGYRMYSEAEKLNSEEVKELNEDTYHKWL